MKAETVIEAYKNGRRDFRGESLRGCNFARLAKKLPNGQCQGVDLSGADFSGCDIRGANFSYANLTGTKFEQAKAGLQWRWVAVLWVASLLLIILGSLFLALAGSLVKWYSILRWVAQISLLVVIIVTWRKNIVVGAEVFAIAFAVTAAVAFALSLSADVTGLSGDYFGYAVGVALAGLSAFAVTIAFAFAVTIAGAFAVTIAGGVSVAFAFAVTIAGAFAGAFARDLIVDIAFAVAFAVMLTTFSGWMGWLTLKREDRDPWLRRIVIAFATLGGTSFYQANLTSANFTQARLKNTNFNQAILNKTSFHNVVKLELARPGKTLLANWRIREFLINPSAGEGQDFRKADLRGANLDNANLKNANLSLADLSQASFVNANLQGANLTEVNTVNADLSHATLTGACVENWNIDATTQLAEVDCQYIYLLNNQKERRPSSGEFEPGEFTKLFAEVFDTVDLIFREGVDWKAFTNAMKQVQVQNEDTPLELQSIENKGDGVVVIKVHVPPAANKEKIHQEFNHNYQLQLAAVEAQYKAQLSAKETEIALYRQHNSTLENIVNTLASKPTNIEIKQTNQDHSQQIDVGRDMTIDADQSTVNLRDLTNPNLSHDNT